MTLTDARRAWRWEGAGSCSGLATHGPSGGNICAAVGVAVVFGVCEILSATEAAIERWAAVEDWIVESAS